MLIGALLALTTSVAMAEEGMTQETHSGLSRAKACDLAASIAKVKVPYYARVYNSDCTCDNDGPSYAPYNCTARLYWRDKKDN